MVASLPPQHPVRETEKSGCHLHTAGTGAVGKTVGSLRRVTLEPPVETSALQCGCEGLGPGDGSGVVHSWLSLSTVCSGGVLVAHSRSGFHSLWDLCSVVSCVIVLSPQTTT